MGFFDFMSPVNNFGNVFMELCNKTLTRTESNYKLNIEDYVILVSFIKANSNSYPRNIITDIQDYLQDKIIRLFKNEEDRKKYWEYRDLLEVKDPTRALLAYVSVKDFIQGTAKYNAMEITYLIYQFSLEKNNVVRSEKQDENDGEILEKIFGY